MVKKLIKSKRKKTINLNILTHELYEALCNYTSMEELLPDSIFEGLGHRDGYYWRPFNKDDPIKCKQIWNIHKKELMQRWFSYKVNDGRRPWIWWMCEAPEPRTKDEGELEYLERLNLLKEWEKKEIELRKRIYEKLEK